MNIFVLLICIACGILIGSAFLRDDWTRRCLVTLAVFIYCFLIANQGVSGSDSHLYFRAFQDYSDNYSLFSNFGFSEPGFWLINYIFSSLSLGFEYINFFNAVLVFFSLYLISVNRSPLLVVLYIPLIGINVDFSTIRQSLGLHVFSIVYFLFRSQFSAVVMGLLFHKSVLISYLVNVVNTKISIKVIALAVSVLLFFNYFFLQRYLSHGSMFVFREGYVFLLQSFLLVLMMIFLGYSKKNILVVALLSFFPIGYRIIFFFLILNETPYPVDRFNKSLMSALLLCFVLAKVVSFNKQSLENDFERSTVLYYEDFFK